MHDGKLFIVINIIAASRAQQCKCSMTYERSIIIYNTYNINYSNYKILSQNQYEFVIIKKEIPKVTQELTKELFCKIFLQYLKICGRLRLLET